MKKSRKSEIELRLPRHKFCKNKMWYNKYNVIKENA